MRQPTLKQLNALVTVLETGHFGEAARRLNVTQPTLSQQIRMLEENLGGPLINRTGIEPTPLGESVAQRARAVLRDVSDIVEVAREAHDGFGGLMRLGVLPTVGPYLLPTVLAEMHARFPSLRLHVREDKPGPLMAGLHEGRFDILVGTLPLDAGWAREWPLFEETISLGVAADHPFASQARVAADDLRDQPMLTLGDGHPLHGATEKLASMRRARVLTEFEGSSLDAVRQMVATGLGIALFPQLYVRSEIERGNDVVVLPLDPPLSRSIGMAWRAGSPRAEQIEGLCAEFSEVVSRALPDLVGS